MEFANLLNSLDAETCDRLRRALELGKWPDGRVLSREQKELCMQAVIAFDHRVRAEHERVGYIEKGKKGTPQAKRDEPQTLNWADTGSQRDKESK
jgi:uncharacterized protein YeaC (DUF1315 family)